jgi:hypothetical protein
MTIPSVGYKKGLIHAILKRISSLVKGHRHRYFFYRRADSILSTLLVGCSSVTLSSVMLDYVGASQTAKLISAIFSSAGFVGGALQKTWDVGNKWAESKELCSRYTDLHMEMMIVLGKNHLTSLQLDAILNDLHHRLSLIETSSSFVYTDDGAILYPAFPEAPSTSQSNEEKCEEFVCRLNSVHDEEEISST